MDNTKVYSGIAGENEPAIKELIISEKMGGGSLRAIAKKIGEKFGVKVSYNTVSAYWKEQCNGELLDSEIEATESRYLMGVGDKNSAPPEIDPNILNALLEKHGKDEKGRLYAYSVALCESNIKAHIEGRERLKPEYIQYLRLVENMRKDR